MLPFRGGPYLGLVPLDDVGVALEVPAGAGDPFGDPGAQRLVAPDDRLDGLSASGTDVSLTVHVLSLGRERTQRFLLYVRTTAPLPKTRTLSRVNSVTAKSEPNIGMPVP